MGESGGEGAGKFFPEVLEVGGHGGEAIGGGEGEGTGFAFAKDLVGGVEGGELGVV